MQIVTQRFIHTEMFLYYINRLYYFGSETNEYIGGMRDGKTKKTNLYTGNVSK